MSRSWDENRWALEEAGVLAELAVLRAAADESARHVRGLYFTFLLFVFYVAVIVFSTTDEQLLKETGAKLPLLNVELPLLGFYIFIPWLVLIFHAHLLNQFYLLSRKLFRLDAKLSSLPPESERTQRELIFPLIFSHVIIGTQHPGPIRWVLKTAVRVTILLTPILLLLATQWMFLRYHDWRITFDHQLVLTLDLLLLWIFWPRLSSRSGHWWDCWSQSQPSRGIQISTILGILMSTILTLGVWILLVPPGHGIERLIGYQPWPDRIRRNLKLRDQILMEKEPPTEPLFAEHVGDDKEKQARIWLEAGEALDLRERDLRYADFYKSQLWDADLRGANLQHAILWETQLQGADMRPIDRAGVEKSTDLRHAQLQLANLKDAKLWSAQLQGADLRGAVVYGTDFREAKLWLTDLRDLRPLPVGWGCWSEPETPLCELECELDRYYLFSKIEKLEAELEQEGAHWSEDGRKRVAQAIDHFWSIAFDLSLDDEPLEPDDEPLEPTAILPPQQSDVMHDQQGLFAAWPAPPDATEFEQARAVYLAELACDDRYIAESMQGQAEYDSTLAKALRAQAESGDCPVLAEVLAEDR